MKNALLIQLLVACFVPGSIADCASAQEGKLLVLVRHAEKEDVPGDNQVLSEAGWERAAALSNMLADTRIDHIITSHLDRTVQTARYVAEDRGLEPEQVSVEGGLLAHVQDVAAAIRRRPDGEAILVVGHSNTIPPIVNELVGSSYPDLDESVYSTVFTVYLSGAGESRIIVSSFGEKY